jgi:hypothetical protein
MATTVDTLLVRIEADMSDLRRTLRRVEQQTEQSQRKMSQSMGRMGTAIKGALGVAAVAIVANFGKELVRLGSSVEEMQAKSSVVFGRFVQDVRSDLEAFGDSVGRSTFELEAMASSVQDTFVPLGFARGEAADLSVQLTKLAVDVASFNNAQDVPTMQAFQSALVGNHEAVRRFGIVITEAELQAELFRMGIKENAADVDAQTKVQARLNLILAGTSDAQGDAARTADSFANRSKALNAALEELGVAVITPLLPLLADIVGALVDATNATKDFLKEIGLINIDLSNNAEIMAKLVELEEQLAKELDTAATAAGRTKKNAKERAEALREEIKLLEERIAINNKAVAPVEEPAAAPAKTKGQIRDEEKAADAVAEQTFLVRQLTRELHGVSAAQLQYNQAVRELPALTDLQKLDLKELIELEHDLTAKLEEKAKADQDAADLEKEKAAAHEQAADVIKQLSSETERLNRELKGETHMYADIAEALDGLTHLREEDRIKITKLIEEQYELEEALKKVREEMEKTDEMTEATLAAIQSMSTGISNALAEMVMSGKFNLDSLKDVFSNFVRTMIAKAFELMVINKIMNAAFNLTGSSALPTASIPGSAGGGAISGPRIVGERGPELFIPSSTGSIKNNMDTKNILGSGQTNVVNQTINIETGVAQTVRAEVLNLMPQIRENTMAAMVDARKRGGSMAAAFGG